MPKFTFDTPNLFIYLGALLRPTNVRPHLRVPNIASVDFVKLKRAGFNAVVIDKDNCLTIPNDDNLYPPLSTAWSDLKATFPGRVLVVSNSAGLLPKDPGAIAAEAVSLNLRAPILVRKRAKPGCARSIISYFRNELGPPTTLRGRLSDEAATLKAQEENEEDEIVKKWEKTVIGPILGPMVDENGNEIHHPEATEATKAQGNGHEAKGQDLGARMRERQYTPTAEQDRQDAVEDGGVNAKTEDEAVVPELKTEEPLRILVIGDRMMTDTLLANRLAKLIPQPTSSTPASTIPPIPSVISIHTTLVPQPKDVRFLRWVEEKLSKSQVRPGPIDWARYMIPTTSDLAAVTPVALSWKERINPFRDTPPLTWSPRSWRPAPLAVGLGGGLWYTSGMVGRGLYKVFSKLWEGEVAVAKALAERAEGGDGVKAEVKKEVGKLELAESILEKPAPS